MSRRRVVITGMGAITPLGDTVEGMFASLLAGKSGVAPITHFDASTFPTTFAAEVKNFELSRWVKQPEFWKDACEGSRYAAAAAKQALSASGLLDGKGERDRFGVYLGTGEATHEVQVLLDLIGRTFNAEKYAIDEAAFGRLAMRGYHPGRQHEQELHMQSGRLADYFDLQGPNYSCLTACAAGTQAIGEAVE
ncbi:MAG: beta-ketoacyl synthase N-terminal-like domain-containing protein, partial [Gemmataceae bacterium]